MEIDIASLLAENPLLLLFTVIGVSVDIDEILDALQGVFMASAMARRGDWSILADLIYLNLANDKNGAVQLPSGLGPGANVNADLEMTGWVWSLLGGYRVYNGPEADLNLMLGARMLSIDTDTKLTVTGPLPPTLPPAKLSKSVTLWDGVIGARGQVEVGKGWFVPYYVDVGTGDSSLTWQAMAGVGYAFDWGGVHLTYRHLEYDQDDDKLIENLSFSGPQIGIGFRF